MTNVNDWYVAEYHFVTETDPVTGAVHTRRTERIMKSHIGPLGKHAAWIDINGAFAHLINVKGDPTAVRIYWRPVNDDHQSAHHAALKEE